MFVNRLFFRTIFDFLFPGNCDFCNALIKPSDHLLLCNGCLAKLTPNVGTLCKVCSHPIVGEGGCPACKESPLLYSENRSLFLNEGFPKQLIYDYKFKKKEHYAHIIADAIFTHQREFLQGFDYIVPVPSGKRQIFERGFCQVTLVGKVLAKKSSIKLCSAFVRVNRKGEVAQHFKSSEQRKAEVTQNYYLNKHSIKKLDGKKVLLMDDVMTTGATLNALYEMLKKSVSFEKLASLTFSRTLLNNEKQ